MTRVEAKREACFHAASVLQDALAAGWETDRLFPVPEDDQAFNAVLQEVIQELLRRGEKSVSSKRYDATALGFNGVGAPEGSE